MARWIGDALWTSVDEIHRLLSILERSRVVIKVYHPLGLGSPGERDRVSDGDAGVLK